MRHLRTLLLIVLAAAGMSSCTKHKNPIEDKYVITGDYFIVGNAGGFTTADATTIYFLVNNGQLRKDMTQLNQAVPEDVNNFNFHFRYWPEDYNSVADLPGSIPSELLNQNNTTFGQMIPDAGYTDVRASINGTVYRWKFGQNVTNCSDVVQQFVRRIRETTPFLFYGPL